MVVLYSTSSNHARRAEGSDSYPDSDSDPDPDLDSDDLQHIQVIHLARLLICHIKLFMLKYVLTRCLSIGFTLPFTVSCFSKIQIGFTFLVPAYLGSPGKGPLNVCSVCSVCRVYTTCSRLNVSINTTLCCKKGAEALHLFSNTVHMTFIHLLLHNTPDLTVC